MYFIKRNLFRILAVLLGIVEIALVLLYFYIAEQKRIPTEMDFGRYKKYHPPSFYYRANC